jgi:hypothetical protein
MIKKEAKKRIPVLCALRRSSETKKFPKSENKGLDDEARGAEEALTVIVAPFRV